MCFGKVRCPKICWVIFAGRRTGSSESREKIPGSERDSGAGCGAGRERGCGSVLPSKSDRCKSRWRSSCTRAPGAAGGRDICSAVPGASEVFKQGFVTYCNRAKRKLLDVKKTTLKEYGAVSDRTAKEMAKNGVFATGADACISLTGLAGPAAEEGKPVGLVYIACCYKNRTVVRECHFKGDRRQIREQSVVQALLLLRECILADQ